MPLVIPEAAAVKVNSTTQTSKGKVALQVVPVVVPLPLQVAQLGAVTHPLTLKLSRRCIRG